MGFTKDISAGGAFVVASHLPPVGARVQLQVQVGAGRTVGFEGVVVRHRLVPLALRRVEPMGFGVLFLSPSQLLEEIAPRAAAAQRFEVRFGDAAGLRQRWQKELRAGGLFVGTECPLAQDERVLVRILADFAGQAFEFPARVVQIVADSMKGVGVAFEEPARVREALAPLVAG